MFLRLSPSFISSCPHLPRTPFPPSSPASLHLSLFLFAPPQAPFLLPRHHLLPTLLPIPPRAPPLTLPPSYPTSPPLCFPTAVLLPGPSCYPFLPHSVFLCSLPSSLLSLHPKSLPPHFKFSAPPLLPLLPLRPKPHPASHPYLPFSLLPPSKPLPHPLPTPPSSPPTASPLLSSPSPPPSKFLPSFLQAPPSLPPSKSLPIFPPPSSKPLPHPLPPLLPPSSSPALPPSSSPNPISALLLSQVPLLPRRLVGALRGRGAAGRGREWRGAQAHTERDLRGRSSAAAAT